MIAKLINIPRRARKIAAGYGGTGGHTDVVDGKKVKRAHRENSNSGVLVHRKEKKFPGSQPRFSGEGAVCLLPPFFLLSHNVDSTKLKWTGRFEGFHHEGLSVSLRVFINVVSGEMNGIKE